MKKLYLFDFDGTLTYKDTMFLYLQFYNEKKYFWNFLKHIPLFVLVKLHLANAEKVKKSFILRLSIIYLLGENHRIARFRVENSVIETFILLTNILIKKTQKVT